MYRKFIVNLSLAVECTTTSSFLCMVTHKVQYKIVSRHAENENDKKKNIRINESVTLTIANYKKN